VTPPPEQSGLAADIFAIYQLPFEEFVSARDALAKRLRAEKRREDAALVKALRKPSRMAWALDQVVSEDPQTIERLSDAIATAQSTRDLRTALETVKEAVRAVAAVAARAAVRAGHPLDPNAIAAAVHAIIGDAAAFDDFRAGRLVDVPAGGGLDLLVALTPNPSATRPAPSAKPSPRETEPPKEDSRVALAASARADLRRAEESLAAARDQLKDATHAVAASNERLEAAERALLRAQSELEERRHEAERRQQQAGSAAAAIADAQRALDKARSRMSEFE
jgi:hypothetical protein